MFKLMHRPRLSYNISGETNMSAGSCRYILNRLWLCLLLISLILLPALGIANGSLYDTVERAGRYIVKAQNADGGWPLIPGGKIDAEVTAMAMQALMLKGLIRLV